MLLLALIVVAYLHLILLTMIQELMEVQQHSVIQYNVYTNLKLVHEMFESITDPHFDAYIDEDGYE